MRKVTMEIASRDAVNRRFRNALAGKAQGTRLSFESPALLIKVLSGRRWDLLKAGLLRKTSDERIVFPYDAIHVDFTLRAA